MTELEKLTRLAGATSECPCAKRGTHQSIVACGQCGGTLRVPLIDGLQEPCGGGEIPGLIGHFHGDLYDPGSFHPDCRGWEAAGGAEAEVALLRWWWKQVEQVAPTDAEFAFMVKQVLGASDPSDALLDKCWLLVSGMVGRGQAQWKEEADAT